MQSASIKANDGSRRSNHADATKMERLHNHLVDPEGCPLTEEEHDYFNTLKQVSAIMHEQYTTAARVAEISVLHGVSDSTAYRHMRDAEILFGQLMRRGHDLDRAIWLERMYDLAEKCLEKEDFITYRFVMKDIAEVSAFKPNPDTIQPGDIVLPIPVYTSNEEVYAAQTKS